MKELWQIKQYHSHVRPKTLGQEAIIKYSDDYIWQNWQEGKREFRLPPQSRWEVRSSVLLHSGTTDRPETSVRNYHYSLRNDPQERSLTIRYITSIIVYFKCAVSGVAARGEGGRQASVSPSASTNFIKIRPVGTELFIRRGGRTDRHDVPSSFKASRLEQQLLVFVREPVISFTISDLRYKCTRHFQENRSEYEITELLTFDLQNSDLHNNCHCL